MRVQLGQHVFSSDGQRVGSVDRIVLDAETKDVQQFVVGSGFFAKEDKLVDHDMVARAGDDGVHLNVSAATVHQLPNFVREEYVEAGPEASDLFVGGVGAGTGGLGGGLLYGSAPVGSQYRGSGSFFEVAPIDPPVVETESNIPTQDIMLGKGSEVVAADGKKVGKVDELLMDDRGRIEAFIVKAGHLFTHDVRIPITQVAEVDDDRVHLSVSAADVR